MATELDSVRASEPHPPSRSTPWRFLRTPATSGARNMAIDAALVEEVRSGKPPTLRLYEWSPACLSLGRNQPGLGHYPADAFRSLGLDVVRRATGGRAVLHDGELTYSVVAPDRELGTPRAAYRRINGVLAAALAEVGVPADVLSESRGPAPIPSTRPCFADPAPGEVHAAGRKLVGSAQLREGGVLLQHGSILLRPSALLTKLARAGVEDLEGDPAYLELLLGRPVTVTGLSRAVRRSWERSIALLEEIPPGAGDLARVDELTDQFATDEWTWRR